MKKLNKLLSNNYIYYGVLIIVIGLLVYSLMPVPKIFGQYEAAIKLNKEKLAQKEELNRQLTVANNEELRLDIARGQYKISKPGEIIFVFPTTETETKK